MSQTDSFIDEVSEEVRRDRLYHLLRRYGWIAVVAILAIVGGAAWSEWQKAQANARAEALGDAILAALEPEAPEARIAALTAIAPESPGGAAVVSLMAAAEEAEGGDAAAAAARLNGVATNAELPAIYRQIAAFKALLVQSATLPVEERRLGFEALAVPGNTLRLLAEEQLALIEVETGAPADAIARLTRAVEDAEATPGLRQRATQLIVALGGEPPQPVAATVPAE